MKWNDLTMKERSDLMSLFLKHGIGSLSDMRRIYDGEGDIEPAVVTAEYPRNKEVLNIVNSSNANWVRRLKDPNRQYIQDWEEPNFVATHKLSWVEDNGKYYIFPNVQEINGRLYDFTNEKKYGENGWRAWDSAIYSGDVVEVPSAADARWFTESYKNFYPSFDKYWSGGRLYSGKTNTDSLLLLSYSSEFPIEMFQVLEEPEIPKGKYKVLDDPAEQTFVRKANEIIDEDRKSTTKKRAQEQLRAMSEDQLIEQQRELADLGFYDAPLSTGRSNIGSGVQDILIRRGYLDKSGKDGIVGRNTITSLQEMLVDEGYLPETTENGRTNIDGILGKRTQEAFKRFYRDYNVDGKLGGRTEQAYIKYLRTSSNPFDKEVDARGMVD